MQILSLEPEIDPEPLRQLRRQLQGGLDRDIVNPRREYIGQILHRIGLPKPPSLHRRRRGPLGDATQVPALVLQRIRGDPFKGKSGRGGGGDIGLRRDGRRGGGRDGGGGQEGTFSAGGCGGGSGATGEQEGAAAGGRWRQRAGGESEPNAEGAGEDEGLHWREGW